MTRPSARTNSRVEWLDTELAQGGAGDQRVHSPRINEAVDVNGAVTVRGIPDAHLHEGQSHWRVSGPL